MSKRKQPAEEIRDLRARRFAAEDRKVCSGESADHPFRVLLETIAEGAATLDPDGTILCANRHLAEMLNLPPRRVAGASILDFIPPDQVDGFAAFLRRSRKRAVRAEFRLQVKGGSPRPVLVSANSLHLDPPALCIAVTDLTERKKTERGVTLHRGRREELLAERSEELARRREEFRSLAENAPDIITRFDRKLRHLYVNPAVEKATGRSPREFIGKTNEELGMPAGLCRLWNRKFRKVFQTGQPQEIEFDFPSPGGLLTYHSRIVPERAGGKVKSVIVLARDVTGQRRAEEALRRERGLLESVMRTTDVMLVFLDRDFNFVWVNSAYAATCRMEPEEMVGKNHFALYPNAENEAIFRKVRDTGRGVFYKDKPFVFPDQPERGVTYWDWSLSPVKDASGKVTGLVFSLRETTEFKRAEIALRESAERLKLAQTAAGAGVWEWEFSSGRLVWSEELYRLFGLDSEKDRADFPAWRRVLHPDDRETAERRIKTAIAQRKPLDSEYRIILPSGEIRWIRALGDTVYGGEGKGQAMSGICIDVSERKKLENLLEARLREQEVILESAPVLIFYKDRENRFLRVNRAFAKAMDLPRAELEGKSMSDLYPGKQAEAYGRDDREVMASGRAKRGIIETMETPRGTRIVRTDKIPYRDENGEIRGVIGFAVDITGIEQSRNALRESEERYRSVVERANDEIIIIREGKIVFANRKMARMAGLPRSRIVGSSFLDYVHPDERGKVGDRYRRRMAGRRVVSLYETVLIDREGRPLPAELNAGRIRFQGETADLVFIRDITKRKQAEEAIRREGERLKSILDSMADLVYITNADYEIEYINPAMKRAVGKIGGKKCYEYLHGRKNVCPECRLCEVLQGKTVRYKWEDTGRGKFYDLIESPIHNPAGTISKLKIMRDITEERRIRGEVEELSRFPSENPNPVIRADGEGVIIYSNVACSRTFTSWKCRPGRPLPPDLRAEVLNALRTGRSRRLEREERGGRTFLYSIAPLKKKGYVNLYVTDISRLKSLEEELREVNRGLEKIVDRRTGELRSANELLERIFDSTHFLIAYLDRDFNFIRVNRAYAAAYRRKPGYFPGKNHFQLFPDQKNEAIFRRVVETGRFFVAYARPFPAAGLPEKGPTYWDWSLRPIKDEKGEVEGLLLILVDVTEEREAEDKLKRVRKKMADMERLAELGTLASMVAHEMRTPLATIRLAADNLARKTGDPGLTRHIRAIGGKIESANQIINNLLDYSRLSVPRLGLFSLVPLVRDCVADARKAHPRQAASVRMKLGPLAGKRVTADRAQLRQVLNNILDNALEACPGNGGKVEIGGRIEGGNTLVLSVRDNGPGFSPEGLEEAFIPFYSSKASGTGLGLAISRDIVHLHGGSIRVENAAAGGALVTLRLPLRPDRP